ncbi:hypothetical protein CGZ94_04895 [Enemella evansiae]|uniref:Uncharacterized protein n=1 Tax=Enemella evansiae TaxID=2016499 RepID=A0A255GKC9_9ACTN|nr:hypothetical protein [Enemella evansiae]OYO16280.1 hypothetical protein CGZ94_04895 [Enemella evansiae]
MTGPCCAGSGWDVCTGTATTTAPDLAPIPGDPGGMAYLGSPVPSCAPCAQAIASLGLFTCHCGHQLTDHGETCRCLCGNTPANQCRCPSCSGVKL